MVCLTAVTRTLTSAFSGTQARSFYHEEDNQGGAGMQRQPSLVSINHLTQAFSGWFYTGGQGGTKCPQPFSLKQLKLLQSNLVH